MIDQRLVDYARRYLNQGYSEQQIQQTLLSSGYTIQTIKEIFFEIKRQKSYVSFPDQYKNPVQVAQHQNDSNHASHHILKVVGIVFIIMLITGFVFFYVLKSNLNQRVIDDEDIDMMKFTTTSLTTTTINHGFDDVDEDSSIELFEVLFCNDIDPFFNCFQNRYDEYERGKNVFIYFKLFIKSKPMSGLYKIGFIEDRQVFNPEGNLISSLSYNNVMDVTREVPSLGTFSIPVYNEIITSENDLPGDYLVKINIRDKYSDDRMDFEITYTLI